MRKQLASFMCLVLVAGMTALSPALAADAALQKFDGFLFSKLANIGTKSEGPAYFLQKFNYTEVRILKHTMLWQPDPALQQYLGTKVTIKGEMAGAVLTYTSVKPYEQKFLKP